MWFKPLKKIQNSFRETELLKKLLIMKMRQIVLNFGSKMLKSSAFS